MGRITLYGFYQYEPDLFKNCIFPEAGDLNLCIEVIMQKSGMLFPFHQALPQLQQNIQNWFHRYYLNFTRMFEALQSDYNPIENYDRKEDWTDTPNVDYTKTGGHTNDIENDNFISGENKVSAFNSSVYEPNTTTSSDSNGSSKETFQYQSEKTSETGTRTHSGRMHGNIGVTTNQQMIESEIALRQYDIYQNIADLFEKEFLIQVY